VEGAPECYSIPDKKTLLSKICVYVASAEPSSEEERDTLAMMQRTCALMMKKPPNSAYLAKLVGMWTPNDEIFNKSYKWVRPKLSDEVESEEFSNDDGFYDGKELIRC